MAIKQFLLNSDGSIPVGANIAALLEAGVPLVLPTPRWRPAEGMMLEEREPQRDDQGVWRQVWVDVPAPPPSEEQIAE
jgi:hypothetical protein